MCMSKLQPGDFYPTLAAASVKSEPYQSNPSDSSRTSCDDNDIIEFGPIRVKPRKRPAPTLATGRRSKYEVLSADEEQKRNVRRARNRAAAERVRLSRLSVEQKLLQEIEQLEKQEQLLMNNVENLQNEKLRLETRLFTHEQMCSNLHASADLTNLFPIENLSTSMQQFEKLGEINFDDLFFNGLTNEQIQENFSESLSTLVQTDDFCDFLMDS